MTISVKDRYARTSGRLRRQPNYEKRRQELAIELGYLLAPTPGTIQVGCSKKRKRQQYQGKVRYSRDLERWLRT